MSASTGYAQGSNELVYSFSNLLIAISVLLVAVGIVFVLVKVAHLVDLISARYQEDESAPRR